MVDTLLFEFLFRIILMKLVDTFTNNTLYPFMLLGNRLCIDFANTSICPTNESGKINTLTDWLFFYEITGVLDRNESQNIQKLAAKESNVFTTLFNKSLSFRSTIRSILHSFETNSNLPPRYIKETNEILKNYEGYYVLKGSEKSYQLEYEYSRQNPDKLLVPIAFSLSTMLTESDKMIRKCANPDCGIYFHDISPKKNRKWCSMELCGNNAKARAFLDRSRKK